ncbi:unnamed protein product [Caenorhabditis angaria]|uniref:C2 domain-containing protein n=1 Tax=Caenorhabditis angaria TaxID=860376 RepID=A0A9P1MVG5_9PELO|nr:unnamed protein product [Caenorhabditis angaria]
MSNILCLLSIFIGLSNCTYSWVTVVLVDFQLRDKCAQFWNEHQNCQNPSLRVIADLGDNRIASASWPINSKLIQEQRLFFTTQWSTKIDKILVSSQIEGENLLNPFGLMPKCDHGYASMVFDEKLILKPGQTMKTRVAHIDSQCFNARFLIRIDDECPHCPKQIQTPIENEQGFMQTLELKMKDYDLQTINMVLLIACLASITVLLILCQFVYGRKSNSSTSDIIFQHPQKPIAVTNQSAKLAKLRRIPTFTSSRYEDIIDETNVTYGYRLKSQTVSKIGFDVSHYENEEYNYDSISTTSTDSTGYSNDF